MAKAKMKQAAIPKFSSEAKEAEWWDSRRPEIEMEIRRRMKQRPTVTLGKVIQGAKLSQPVTLRIAKADLETARRLAAEKRFRLPDVYQDAAAGGVGEERGGVGL